MILRMCHAKGGQNGVARIDGSAVAGDQTPLAASAPETRAGTTTGGCAAVFRGDPLDSVDGSPVERAAGAVREQEHGAPAAVRVGAHRGAVESVACVSGPVE